MKEKKLPYGAIKQTAEHFGVTIQTVHNAIKGHTHSVQSKKILTYIAENFTTADND